jgi:hypothetical protein
VKAIKKSRIKYGISNFSSRATNPVTIGFEPFYLFEVPFIQY